MKKLLTLLALSLFAFSTALTRTECGAAPAADRIASPCSAPAEMPKPAFKLTLGQKIAHALLEKRLKKQLRKQGFAVPRPLASDCDTIVMKDGRIVLGEDVEVTAEGVFYSKCGANDGAKYLIKAEDLSTVKGISYQQTPSVFTPLEAKMMRSSDLAIMFSALTSLALLFGAIFAAANSGLVLIVLLSLPLLLVTVLLSSAVSDRSSALPDGWSKKEIRRKARMAMLLLWLAPVSALVFLAALNKTGLP